MSPHFLLTATYVVIRISMSKSGRRLSRQHSHVSEGVSEASATEADHAEAVRPASSSKVWQLLKLNRPEWGYGALGCVGSVLCGLLNPFFALILSNVLTAYYNSNFSQMRHDIFTWAMVFIGLAGVSIIGYFTQHFFFGLMSENLIKRVREIMFARKYIHGHAPHSVVMILSHQDDLMRLLILLMLS